MVTVDLRCVVQLVPGSPRRESVPVADIVLVSDVGRQVLRTITQDEADSRDQSLLEAAERWVETYLHGQHSLVYPTEAERRAGLF